MKNNKIKLTGIFFLIILTFSCSNKEKPEVVIPEVAVVTGGIVEAIDDRDIIYYNETESREDSFIQLTKTITREQQVNRYLEISGVVDLKHPYFFERQYRSVIFEVKSSGKSDFYTIAFDKKDTFQGYIYFKHTGMNRVYAYLFYDYLSFEGIESDNAALTTASLSFAVQVNEAVPGNLVYLLPTKNVDCGNRKLRELAQEIVKDCTSDLDKARTVYEYLVFDSDKGKPFQYASYKDAYDVYGGNNYHDAYSASQALENRDGICHDFAEVYAALTRALGFKVKRVWGYYNEAKILSHMWNVIDVAGDGKQWLKVDASWGNINKKQYKQWGQFYPEFDGDFFEHSYQPYSHASFSYERISEY